MKFKNMPIGKTSGAELLASYSLEKPMIKDDDWKLISGKVCRVIKFVPLAVTKNGAIHKISPLIPYATVVFECEGIPHPIEGQIWHKLDFKNLWAAFKERMLGENEVLIIDWIKYRLRGWAKLMARAMPGFSVMVFTKEGLKLLTDNTYRPELGGEARFEAERPIAEWTAEIYNRY